LSGKRAPLEWAYTQDSLGVALAALGEHGNSSAELKEAIEAYHAALEVFRDADAASNIKETEANLARAAALLAKQRDASAAAAEK